MTWAVETWLWALLLVPAVFALLLIVDRKLRMRWKIYTGKLLPRTTFIRPWQLVILLLGITMIIVALARPRAGFEWRDIERRGAEIMVVVDVSQSMLAEDIKPNRLERARREIMDLLAMLEGDRIGLVLFAGVGFVQCPLTLDYSAMGLFLDHISESNIPVQGTAIGDALRLAIHSLENSEAEEGVERAIILITDGEDHESKPIAAAYNANEAGIKIYSIGMGSEGGAPVPKAEGGFVKDRQGRLVMSRLDESTLRQIAEITGGAYVRSTSGDLDLDVIYRQHIRKDLGQGNLGESREKVWFEQYWLAAGLALLLLSLEFSIPFISRMSRVLGFKAKT